MTYEEKLKELALNDDRIVVMTAENRAAIRGLPGVLGDRFIDTGITEQTMIGAAAGLALRGRIPVAHALATFLTLRAFEFIRTDVGIPALPVKLVGAVPGFLSDGNGPTHQAIEDIAILRGIPAMRVFCPADNEELVAGLSAVVLDPHPWYIRFNARPAVVTHSPFEIGRAEVFESPGYDASGIAILTYGTLFTECLQAKKLLEEKGGKVRLVNLRTVKPIDEAAVIAAVRESRLVVTVEDHFLTGGLYSILSEICLRNRLAPASLPVALDGHWFKPARLAELMEYEGFTATQIAQKIWNRL